MAKRSASSSATDLIEHLVPLRNDPDKLHEALARVDTVLFEDAFAQLLDVAASVKGTAEKRQKMARSRPCIPNETFEDVAAYLDRDTLDSMQLACRFMHDFIRKREKDKLALRFISKAEIGKTVAVDIENAWGQNKCWLPISFVDGGGNNEQRLNSVHRLSVLLRLSHCKDVCIDVEYLQVMADARDANRPTFDNVFGVLFDDLSVKDTSVGVLTVKMDKGCTSTISRCIDTFKSVKEVRLDVDNLDSSEAECFDEAFFGNLARRGVWSFEFSTYDGVEMNTKTALAFGFAAESGKDFNRSLAGINFGEENDLLAEIRKKASKLDGEAEIDILFAIYKNPDWNVDPIGFEKYQKSAKNWVFDDLQNRITVDVTETKDVVQIYMYYSSRLDMP